MSEISTLERLIGSLGFPIVVAVWLLYRDYRFHSRLDRWMARIITLLENMNGNSK